MAKGKKKRAKPSNVVDLDGLSKAGWQAFRDIAAGKVYITHERTLAGTSRKGFDDLRKLGGAGHGGVIRGAYRGETIRFTAKGKRTAEHHGIAVEKPQRRKRNPPTALAQRGSTAPIQVQTRSAASYDPYAAGRLVMLLAVTAGIHYPDASPEEAVAAVANETRMAVGAEAALATGRAGRDPFKLEQVAFALAEMMSILEIAEPLAVDELRALRRKPLSNPSTPEGQAALYAWIGQWVGGFGGSLAGLLVGSAAAAAGATGAGVALAGLGAYAGTILGARYGAGKAPRVSPKELRETKNYATFGALLMPWFGIGPAVGAYIGAQPNPRFEEGSEPFTPIRRLTPGNLEALGYTRHGGLPMVFAQMRTGEDFAAVLREMKLGPPHGLADDVSSGRLEAYVLARHQPKRGNWSYATVATYDPVQRRFSEMAGPRNRPPKKDDRDLFYRVLMENLRYGTQPNPAAATDARGAVLSTEWPPQLVKAWGDTGITAGAMADGVVDTAKAAGWSEADIMKDPRGAMLAANEIWLPAGSDAEHLEETGWGEFPEYVENPRRYHRAGKPLTAPPEIAIQLTLADGSTSRVQGFQVTPQLVVHPSIRTGQEIGHSRFTGKKAKSWGITHAPTGQLVATVSTRKWADMLAREIQDFSGRGIASTDVWVVRAAVTRPDSSGVRYINHIMRQASEPPKKRGKFPTFHKWQKTSHELDENPWNPESLKADAAVAAAVGSIVGAIAGAAVGAVVLGGVGAIAGAAAFGGEAGVGGGIVGAIYGIPLGGAIGTIWGAVRQTGQVVAGHPEAGSAKLGAGLGSAFFGPIGAGLGAYVGAPG